MSRRGTAVLSVVAGLFVLAFGVLGLRALALGPDATPEGEIVRREAALARSSAAIAAVRDEQLPPLPEVPQRDAAGLLDAARVGAIGLGRLGDDDDHSGERRDHSDDHDGDRDDDRDDDRGDHVDWGDHVDRSDDADRDDHDDRGSDRDDRWEHDD